MDENKEMIFNYNKVKHYIKKAFYQTNHLTKFQVVGQGLGVIDLDLGPENLDLGSGITDYVRAIFFRSLR